MINHFAPWWENPICVIDFETTGVDPETCHPVQVAAVRFDRGEMVGDFSSLINPGVPIPIEATAVHGITYDIVGNCPPAESVLCEPGMQNLLDGAIPCAYNVPFDQTIMTRYLGLPADPDMPADPWIDPLVMVRKFHRFDGGDGRHKLGTICRKYGIGLKAHEALSDATATGKLLWAMRGKLGDMTYSELIRRQRINAAEQNKNHHVWSAYYKARDWANAEQERRAAA